MIRISFVALFLMLISLVNGMGHEFTIHDRHGDEIDYIYRNRINYTFLESNTFDQWDNLVIRTNKENTDEIISDYNPDKKRVLVHPAEMALSMYFCIKDPEADTLRHLDTISIAVHIPPAYFNHKIITSKNHLVYDNNIKVKDTTFFARDINSHLEYTKDFYIRFYMSKDLDRLVKKNRYGVKRVELVLADRERNVIKKEYVGTDSISPGLYRFSIPENFPSKNKIEVLGIMPETLTWRGNKYFVSNIPYRWIYFKQHQ